VLHAEDELEEEEAGEEAEASRSESAASAASYWDNLLRQHWQQLEKEEGGLHGRIGTSPSRTAGVLSATA
jgi:hypothetical protein